MHICSASWGAPWPGCSVPSTAGGPRGGQGGEKPAWHCPFPRDTHCCSVCTEGLLGVRGLFCFSPWLGVLMWIRALKQSVTVPISCQQLWCLWHLLVTGTTCGTSAPQRWGAAGVGTWYPDLWLWDTPWGRCPACPCAPALIWAGWGCLTPAAAHSTGITSARCSAPPARCPHPFPGDAQPGVNACQPRWLQPSRAPTHPLLLRFAPATKQLIFVDRGGVLGSLCSSRRQRDTPWSPGISWHFAQMASVCVSRT